MDAQPERFDHLAVDLSMDQGIGDGAPTKLKTVSQTKMRRREHLVSGEQNIGEVEEGITPLIEEFIHLLMKGRQHF